MAANLTNKAVVRVAAVVARGRFPEIDALRGLAVASMVVDHCCLALGIGWPRVVCKVIGLPLWCLTLGAVGRGRRAVLWAGLGLALMGGFPLIVGVPGTLLSLTFGKLVQVRVGRWWWLAACVGALSAGLWPLAVTGYQPGLVVGMVCIGGGVGGARVAELGRCLPGWFGVVGRRSLLVYVASVVVVALAVF